MRLNKLYLILVSALLILLIFGCKEKTFLEIKESELTKHYQDKELLGYISIGFVPKEVFHTPKGIETLFSHHYIVQDSTGSVNKVDLIKVLIDRQEMPHFTLLSSTSY